MKINHYTQPRDERIRKDVLQDLEIGLTYNDFKELYGMDVPQADATVRDLKHEGYNIKRVALRDTQRVQLPEEHGGEMIWVRDVLNNNLPLEKEQ